MLRGTILSFLMVLVCNSFSYGASAAKLRLGYSAITATMAPLWAGRDNAFFAKYGIDPELIYLAGGARIALAAAPRAGRRSDYFAAQWFDRSEAGL